MKKLTFLGKTALLSLLLVALAFTSCKKDDDDDARPVDNNEIVGRWLLTDIAPEAPGTTIQLLEMVKAQVPCLYSLKFTFTNKNKVSLADCDAAVSLLSSYLKITSDTEWKVEAGKLLLKNGTTTSTFGLVQNTDTMKIIVNLNETGTPLNVVMSLKRL